MLFSDITILDEALEPREHRYVGIRGDTIEYIGSEAPLQDYGEVVDGRDRLLMPGFVNAHAHSPMSLMRGYGENLSLQDWLFGRIFPFEAKLTGEAVYWGTLLSMAESLKYGIVSTSDMYYMLDDMVQAVEESGCKANIAHSITNPTGECFGTLKARELAFLAALKYNGCAGGRIKIDLSLHAEYTSDEQTARGLAEANGSMGLIVQVHVSETKKEHEECKARHGGRTPTEYLADCGLFDCPAIAAHCVWIEDGDYDILRRKGVTVATNPVSNLKLASGICDVRALMDRGIRVAVGTDSVASNNNLSMFEEMKTMLLLAKIRRGDPTVISPREALLMATANGAAAQGRTDSGLIKTGNKADLVMLRTDSPNMRPVHDIVSNIVLSATDSDIVMTVVDGRVLYREGEYTTIDIERTAYEVDRCVRNILSEL